MLVNFKKKFNLFVLSLIALLHIQCQDRIVTSNDYEVYDIRRPDVIHSTPVDDAIINNLQPEIKIWFDELIEEETLPGSFSFRPEVSLVDINALIIDGSIEGRLYASSETQGIFRSDDNGDNWSWVSRNSLRQGVDGFKIDPSKENLWAFSDDVLLISSDFGVSFETIEPNFTEDVINVLEFLPSNSNRLYFGTGNGDIYLSEDGGYSWTISSSGLPGNPIYDIAICPENPQLMFVNSTENYLFKSIDGGINWSRHRAGLPFRDFSSIKFHPIHGNVLYAGSLTSGLVVSHDYGESWTNISSQLPTKKIDKIFIDQADTNSVYVLASGKIFFSNNEGIDWQDLTENSEAEMFECFTFEKNTFLLGNDDGIMLSTNNGENFNKSNTIIMEELNVPGNFYFEVWSDTLTIISMLDSAEYDTIEITPYVEPRALENWKPGTKPPVDIHPDATMIAFQIQSGFTLFPKWEYRVRILGRFEDDKETLKDVEAVKDLSGNSLETDFDLNFTTTSKEE